METRIDDSLMEKSTMSILLQATVLVTAFGYFIDAFDLVLFSVVRTDSIKALGLISSSLDENAQKSLIKTIGISLENWQNWGILLGGIFWGILGDIKGRRKVLYGSIACYSIANLLNGFLSPGIPFVQEVYSVLRFISGFGLAGELGVGITIVAEVLPKETRGIGTMWIASIGLFGCVLASSLKILNILPWNQLFILGGLAGLILLFLRFGVHESEIFNNQEKNAENKGSLVYLFSNFERAGRFLKCIAVGLPVYFVVSLPIKFSTNFGEAFGIPAKDLSVPVAIMMCYIAMAVGDIVCNLLSQKLKSRKLLMYGFNILNFLAILCFVFFPPTNATQYLYIYCPILGFSVGYWALIVTNAAEQFGTNLRATVATSVPNFIRASSIPILVLFGIFEKSLGSSLQSAIFIGLGCSSIGLLATYLSKETFGKDLNYSE